MSAAAATVATTAGKGARPGGTVAPGGGGGSSSRAPPPPPPPPAAASKESKSVPEVLVDVRGRRRYWLGRFLGKGGFAKCYEITDTESKEVFAGKIVPKSLLLKAPQKEKMSMEIAIHRSLTHRHVVGFQGFFEDSNFVFVVLELCRRRVKAGDRGVGGGS